MKSSRLIFRKLQRSEYERGMEAIGRLWRKNHILSRDSELFLWQYGQTKEDTLDFFIAEDRGKIQGFSGLIRLPCHTHGRPISGGVGALTIMAPDYRDGLDGLKLIEMADEGLSVVGSFGINSRVARLYQLQGRFIWRCFPRIAGVGDSEAFKLYLGKGTHANSSKSPEMWAPIEKRIPSGDYVLVPLDESNLDVWQSAWQGSFAPFLIGVERNGAYIKWRYLDHPSFDYDVMLLLKRDSDVAGLLVYRIISLPHAICAMRILDFLSLDTAAGGALAAHVSALVPENCAYVEFSALGAQGRFLTAIGLTEEVGRSISVYTNPPDLGYCAMIGALKVNLPDYTPESFVHDEHIYLTLADGDQDRPN